MQTQESKKNNGANKTATANKDDDKKHGTPHADPASASSASSASSTETLAGKEAGKEADKQAETEKKPELTHAQKKIHLETYQSLHDMVTVAEEELEAARGALRDHAKVMYEAMGPGPFGWKGGKVKIAKAKSGGYTFRGESQTDVEQFD